MAALRNHDWPGNVRELRNVLERAAVLCSDREIHPEDLRLPREPSPVQARAPAISIRPFSPPSPAEPISVPKTGAADARTHLRDMERQMIMEAMARNRNNKAAVARELGIPLSTLKRRLKDYQVDDEE
jgi:DNA-binding NtrC family response regulator